MKSLRDLKLYLGLSLVACTVSACNPSEHPRPRIAALLKSSTNPFFAMMWEGIKSEADRRGIDVQLYWGKKESDFAFQSNFLKKEAQGFDGIIFAPSNPSENASLLAKLKSQKKKIVILDEGVPVPSAQPTSRYYDTFIATDNAAGGQIAAAYAAQHLTNHSRVTVLAGFDFDKPRTVAFKKALRSKFPDIKISEFAGYFDRQRTRAVVRRHLALFEGSDVIYCASDHMALGVIQELPLAKHKHHPRIIGYDSIREAQEAILQGTLAASVVQFPAKMGSDGVSAMDELLHGNKVPAQSLIQPELSIRQATVQTVKLTTLLGDKPPGAYE